MKKPMARLLTLSTTVLLSAWIMPERHVSRNGQDSKPDLSVTSVFAGPANESRFCLGHTNRVYVTVRRAGGTAFSGPIPVWLVGRGVTGRLATGGSQSIEYIRGAHSWLLIFRDVRVDADWRSIDPMFTVIVNPETDGKHAIVESNYNNNSYTLNVGAHTDWSRKCP